VKYTSDGEAITVRAYAERGDLAVEVIDSGQGRTPEDLARIFEPFTRADRLSRDETGTGLGLPIVRAIVEAHGGSVEAASASGEGARRSGSGSRA
jgi:two-component system sensor histidine kinase BaeS